MIDLKDYNETGYVVIKNWLGKEERKEFLLDYKNNVSLETKTYKIKTASEEILSKFKSKILEVCNAVNQATGQNIDLICPSAISANMYADTEWIKWTWHQDHEPTFFLQTLKDYVMLYTVLFKDNPELSGLSVVPNNRINSLLTKEQKQFIFNGVGAKSISIENGITKFRSDISGKIEILPFDLNDLVEHVNIESGDLLLMKGDLIHQTQDSKTRRIAVSLRCVSSDSPLSLEKHKIKFTELHKSFYHNNKKIYDEFEESYSNKEKQTVGEVFNNFRRIHHGK